MAGYMKVSEEQDNRCHFDMINQEFTLKRVDPLFCGDYVFQYSDLYL